MTRRSYPRREFLRGGVALGAAAALPVVQIELACAMGDEKVMVAVIADAHIQQVRGQRFVRNWDRGLIRAVAEVNLLDPAPDFVVFGGDLAALGRPAELDHGADILSALRAPVRHVMGEADYYLDLGEYWSRLFGAQWYSFDHKGLHFVVLNSILTDQRWLRESALTPEERVLAMTTLGHPAAAPFMVGDPQLTWLAQDLRRVGHRTPIVVFSHAPLQRIYRGWNFWTEDAEAVQALLRPFERVTVLYAHVHQLQYGQVGSISFQSVVSTAWPHPYLESYAQAEAHTPALTVPMNRADPFFERDGTGWQFANLDAGRAEVYYNLYNNSPRSVAFNPAARRPQDAAYPTSAGRESQNPY